MKVLDLKQNSPEWLEFRRDKIGASDAATIMGISPWSTPYQLWMEKKSGESKVSTYAMKRGHDLEESARDLFEKKTGIKVLPSVVQSLADEWQIASLDGLSLQGDTFVEIKVPNKEVMGMAKEGKLPDHYMAQLQHQMLVSDLAQAYYFVYDGYESHLVDVKADNLYMRDMYEKEKAFFQIMKGDEAPELTDRDYAFRDDEAWEAHASNYLTIHAEIKRLEANLDKEKKSLIDLAGDKNSKGKGVSFSSFYRKGAIDSAKIAEEFNLDLEKFRKKGSLVKMVSILK